MRPLPLVSSLLLAGAAFLTPARADVELQCPTTPNSVGAGAELRWLGPLDPAQGRLRVTGLPADTFGMVIYGTQPDSAPFGNGTLCMAPGFIMGRQVSDASGQVLFDIGQEADLEDGRYILYLRAQGIDTWLFQYAYRDRAAGGEGFNTSNALRVTFD